MTAMPLRRGLRSIAGAVAIVATAAGAPVAAQEQPPAAGRAAIMEQAQTAKAADLRPYEPDKVEDILNRVESVLLRGVHLHPFFVSAYSGGGFTLGAGYLRHVSAYNTIDLRGSYTLSGYKRLEAEFMAPRLFNRRGAMTLTGGWREATQVGFYGIGTENTSDNDRSNYAFDQPYGSATVDFWPARKLLLLRGGLELSTWNTAPGGGTAKSVDEVYTAATLPGLGAAPTYLHSQLTIALDSRPSPGYARRGSFFGVTYNDFHDRGGKFGFNRLDYEATQHVPILKETWVLSLHARAELAAGAEDQTVPYFMMPALGGGSSLRGFTSWRFRDLNSLLLQAEWRVIGSRAIDMALFYDAGRVAPRRQDLTSAPLKSDYGVGFRLHGRVATPLRIEIAHGNEGFSLVFSSKAPF
jgi:hypothetical protein